MSLNRQTAKTFFKSLDKYESIQKMVVRAVDPVKPSLVKTHAKNRVKLDDTFIEISWFYLSPTESLSMDDSSFQWAKERTFAH